MVYTEEPADPVLNQETEVRSLGSEKWRECSKNCRGELWKIGLAEAFGTALLILLTCLPGCSPDASTSSLAQRALTGGLVVAVIVQCFDHVSGAQLNPTVTLAAALARRFSTLQAVVMCAAQLIGGTLGAAALLMFASPAVYTCVTKPANFISVYQALAIETMLGGCLALANLAAWDPRNRHLIDSWPLRIGFIVVALSFVAGDLTGASMNPVRSFAPALLTGNWEALWVYWVGPLSGSCLSAVLYASVWRAPSNAPARELTPLPRRRTIPPHAQLAHAQLQPPHKLHLSA